jgi:hypothetical protein
LGERGNGGRMHMQAALHLKTMICLVVKRELSLVYAGRGQWNSEWKTTGCEPAMAARIPASGLFKSSGTLPARRKVLLQERLQLGRSFVVPFEFDCAFLVTFS